MTDVGLRDLESIQNYRRERSIVHTEIRILLSTCFHWSTIHPSQSKSIDKEKGPCSPSIAHAMESIRAISTPPIFMSFVSEGLCAREVGAITARGSSMHRILPPKTPLKQPLDSSISLVYHDESSLPSPQ